MVECEGRRAIPPETNSSEKMKTYEINSDSHNSTITAASADEAANKFDRSVKTMYALIAKVETMGGYITVTEDDVVIERVAAN